MRPILLCLALLSACTGLDEAIYNNGRPIVVGEYTVNVGPMEAPVGYYAAMDVESLLASDMAPAHIRIAAIEQVTGCPVDPLTVRHIHAGLTTARSVC